MSFQAPCAKDWVGGGSEGILSEVEVKASAPTLVRVFRVGGGSKDEGEDSE
jgi:hypothetical protein